MESGQWYLHLYTVYKSIPFKMPTKSYSHPPHTPICAQTFLSFSLCKKAPQHFKGTLPPNITNVARYSLTAAETLVYKGTL